jgi:hypothetical protein
MSRARIVKLILAPSEPFGAERAQKSPDPKETKTGAQLYRAYR